MTKHTRGPWKVCAHWKQKKCGCGDHRGYIWDGSGEIVVAQLGVERDEGGLRPFPEGTHEQRRADAHLIAAAPDLLAWVEEMAARDMEHDVNCEEVAGCAHAPRPRCDCYLSRMNAALAKTRGAR